MPEIECNALITPADAAARLRVRPRTLEFWRARGHGPRFVRLGEKTIRYTIADLDAFVEAMRTAPSGIPDALVA
jgi:hypothetical protein